MPRLPALPEVRRRGVSALEPEVGHWLMRLVRKGPLVPARIYWCDSEPGEPTNKRDRWPPRILVAEIDGKLADVDDVWTGNRRSAISESEYNFRVADAEHARQWRPDEPQAQPRKSVNLATIPPIYVRRAAP